MKNYAKKIAKRLISLFSWDEWCKFTWSQEGEDSILSRYFESYNGAGFYVDIGAHHPYRFSNTMKFYRIGWRGINIDAMPGSMIVFKKIRPKDINIEIGVGLYEEKKTYYYFNEPALNGFDKNLSVNRDAQFKEYKIINTMELSLKPLQVILNEYLPENQQISFMSIDVEGLDFDVLQSNDWEKFRPELVLVEKYSRDIQDVLVSDMNYFMEKNGYKLFAKTVNTIIFRDQYVTDPRI